MASVTPRMQWATTLSRRADARHAVAEAAEGVLDALGGPPDLVLMFASAAHAPSYERMLEAANSVLPARCMLGCSAVGTIGAGVEVERSEAISLVAARLPGVELLPFYMPGAPRAGAVEPWSEVIGADPREMGCYVLLADPFSIEAESWLERFDAACPNVPKIGGLLSGADAPGDGALFHGERVYRNGLLGLGMRGNIELSAVVAQGCRPIGEPMIITSCKDSVIYELDAGRPVDVLQKLFDKLDPRDQELCRHSLFVGIEMSARSSHRYGQGDFLIRDLAGMDPNGGAMALQGRCRNYQVVQFHLRDARTSAQELEQRLRALRDSPAAERARGALLFSCLGRGRSLYGTPNHDTDAFVAAMGALPAGGFFAGGEIGPVGGRTFLHGYTSVFGVFGSKQKSEDGAR
jgi:small ligand-binding sensory domain FIST